MIEPREDKIYYSDPHEVIIPDDRVRIEFDKGKLKELVDSLLDKGQIQPGVCRLEDDKVFLIAGQRRLLACMEAQVPFRFTLDSETDPIRILEIELEENLHRVDLNYRETSLGIARLHALMQEQDGVARPGAPGGHGTRDTARFLGMSVGKVSEELELADYLDIPEVSDAKTKTDAKKVIKRMREEFAVAKALKEARARDSEELGHLDSPPLEDDGSGGEGSREVLEVSREDSAKQELESRLAYYSDRIREGRMEDEIKNYEDGTFNIVCFDPPWGVNYDSVGEFGGDKQKFDDGGGNLEAIKPWLELLFNKMGPDSHLYMFFGIVHYELIYRTLHDVGFQTNDLPLIWYKQGAHRTRDPDKWPGRSYEPIAYARKGNKLLIQKGAPDVIITPAPYPSMKKWGTATKHPDVYINLLKRSALPGDKVLDPMCGSGMFGVACETLRPTHSLDWLMIEEQETFIDLSIMNVARGYHAVLNLGDEEKLVEGPDPAEYVLKDLPEDFKELEPGTNDWKRYWTVNPDKQDEMLAWQKEKEA